MDYFIAIIMTLIALVFDLLLIALINAIRIKAEYLQGKEYDEDINAELPQKYAKDLSEMIKVRTVSERGKDYSESINEFHKCLEKLYPNIHKNLEKINIDGALLFKWKGNNSD